MYGIVAPKHIMLPVLEGITPFGECYCRIGDYLAGFRIQSTIRYSHPFLVSKKSCAGRSWVHFFGYQEKGSGKRLSTVRGATHGGIGDNYCALFTEWSRGIGFCGVCYSGRPCFIELRIYIYHPLNWRVADGDRRCSELNFLCTAVVYQKTDDILSWRSSYLWYVGFLENRDIPLVQITWKIHNAFLAL